MSLFRPLAEWPLLICGPVLRRVTPTRVSVFVVTSAPCTVEILLSTGGQQVAASPATSTRTIGALLHAIVATVVLPDASPLTPDVVYAYDVRMTPTLPAGPAKTLADQPGLLTGPRPLGYRDGALPSFALPTGLQYLHLLHASCRKPHGGGPDATAIIDSLVNAAHGNQAIANTVEDARRRPHQLLLTGDQIYADDVAVSLLPVLIDVGGLLLGETVKERFAGNAVMTDPAVRPGPSRRRYLEANTKLSSGAMENHLMYFAEFCAMYVLVWSDELWARDGGGVPRLDPLDPATIYPARQSPDWTKADDVARARALTHRGEVLSFAKTVRRVRRVLANVPTMMMFDDHEISDDWNIDSGWVQDSRTDPGTHQVVRNGLLAQALFQAWGNLPTRFEAGVGKALLDLITVPTGQLRTPLAVTPAAADVLLDIAPTGPSPAAQRVQWDWTLDGPQHRIIGLDTRTHRDFTTGGPNKVGLLTEAEMTRQLTANKPTDPSTLVFVIAPAPVVGHPLVEEALQPMVTSAEGVREADSEAWGVNRPLFEAFLRRLGAFGRVVLLSGDVHYGYTNHTAYFGPAPQTPSRFVQLCASAAKNADELTRAIQTAGYLTMVNRGWLGFSTPITTDGGAKLRAGLRAMTEANPRDKVLRDIYFRLIVEDRLTTPPVIPAGPWFTDAATAEVAQIVALGRPDDWAYRTTYLSDTRTTAQRLTDLGVTPGSSVPQTSRQFMQDLAVTVVGEPNIGQIRLRMTQGNLQVVHRLHWYVPAQTINTDTAPAAYTEHVAPLTVPTAADRPTVFKLPTVTP
ncbi:hypothetical protein [Micromonospora vulcania]|uniref:DUF7800 domain-containing protein n=1 Tax=Micromonospora vulcania TaxID=1441873 RepID=A0ABW1H6B3_9ACTN